MPSNDPTVQTSFAPTGPSINPTRNPSSTPTEQTNTPTKAPTYEAIQITNPGFEEDDPNLAYNSHTRPDNLIGWTLYDPFGARDLRIMIKRRIMMVHSNKIWRKWERMMMFPMF
eukprot:53131_1